MNNILNLQKNDPFAIDLDDTDHQSTNIIHIRLQQRNGKKVITVIENLDSKLDHSKILRAMTKKFCCGGHLEEDEDKRKILVLNGDHRRTTNDFIKSEQMAEKIIIHGYD
jgi:translation initiation factor 1